MIDECNTIDYTGNNPAASQSSMIIYLDIQCLRSIEYGSFYYPLKHELEVLMFSEDGNSVCQTNGAPFIKVCAASPNEAIQAFSFQFHLLYQTINALAPFERNSIQKEQWKFFQSIIDQKEYEQNNPQRCHLRGMISKIEGEIVHISWLGGRTSSVSYSKTPINFVLFKENDWFDAVIDRDWDTERTLKIVDALPCDAPSLTKDDIEKFWNITQQ